MTSLVSLGEVATLYDSLHKTPGEYTSVGYPMIRVTDINRGFVNLSIAKFVDEDTYLEFSKKHKPKVGDIIYARVGNTFGKSSYVNVKKNFCLGQNLVCITAEESKIDPFYLYSFLNSEDGQAQMRAKVAGGAQPTISLKSIKELSLNLPSLDIQKEISGILNAYDNLIENNNRRIAILEEMAQSLYREWFVHYRFPGHENTKFIESSLGKIPEGWEVKTIGDLAEYVNRGIAPKYSDDSEDSVINQKCIRNFKIDMSLARRHIKKVPEDKLVRYGDVLVNSTGVGTLGRVAQVLFETENVTVDTHVTIVRPGKTMATEYWGCALEAMQGHFERLGEGATGQTELKRQLIGDSLVVLPPQELVGEFSTLVRSGRASIQLLLRKNENLKTQRDLILPKLISGKIQLS